MSVGTGQLTMSAQSPAHGDGVRERDDGQAPWSRPGQRCVLAGKRVARLKGVAPVEADTGLPLSGKELSV